MKAGKGLQTGAAVVKSALEQELLKELEDGNPGSWTFVNIGWNVEKDLLKAKKECDQKVVVVAEEWGAWPGCGFCLTFFFHPWLVPAPP